MFKREISEMLLGGVLEKKWEILSFRLELVSISTRTYVQNGMPHRSIAAKFGDVGALFRGTCVPMTDRQ